MKSILSHWHRHTGRIQIVELVYSMYFLGYRPIKDLHRSIGRHKNAAGKFRLDLETYILIYILKVFEICIKDNLARQLH